MLTMFQPRPETPPTRQIEARSYDPTSDLFLLSMAGSRTTDIVARDIVCRNPGYSTYYKNCSLLVNGSISAKSEHAASIPAPGEGSLNLIAFDDLSLDNLDKVAEPPRAIALVVDCPFRLFHQRQQQGMLDERAFALWKQYARTLVVDGWDNAPAGFVPIEGERFRIDGGYRERIAERLGLGGIDGQAQAVAVQIMPEAAPAAPDAPETPPEGERVYLAPSAFDADTLKLYAAFACPVVPEQFRPDEMAAEGRKLDAALDQCLIYASRGEHHLGVAMLTALVPDADKRRQAADGAPETADGWLRASYLYSSVGEYHGAFKAIDRAIGEAPIEPERTPFVVLLYQAALYHLARLEDGYLAFFRARRMLEEARPEFKPVAALNLINALIWVREYDKAERLASEWLENHPERVSLKLARAFALFNLNRYREAYQEFEVRLDVFKSNRNTMNALDSSKLFDPHNPSHKLDYSHVLLYAEQGAGDCIQFVRYVKPFCERHPNTTFSLCVPQSLKRLFYECLDVPPNVLGIVTKEDVICRQLQLTSHQAAPTEQGQPIQADPLRYDFYIPLLSLPLLGNMADEKDPNPGYLRMPEVPAVADVPEAEGDPEFAALRVGFCYKGNQYHTKDYERSLPKALADKVAHHGTSRGMVVQMLQPGEPLDGCQPLPEGADFLETARVIAALDVVVTVDTSVAHLSGALGKPAFLLVPYRHDWRWSPKLGVTVSPWYPASVTLLRQSDSRRWEPVVENALALLDVI